MYFQIVIRSPADSQVFLDAFDFCQAIITSGHHIHQLFLAEKAVQFALSDKLATRPYTFTLQHFLSNNIKIECCVNSAKIYGLLDDSNQLNPYIDTTLFTLSGMSSLLKEIPNEHRMLIFA